MIIAGAFVNNTLCLDGGHEVTLNYSGSIVGRASSHFIASPRVLTKFV